MRISKKCEYALRAVFELAVRNTGQPVKIHELAGAQQIPARFLEVILNELRHAGVVDSRRGNKGGYMLARAANDLTVGEVIRHIQGPFYIAADKGRKRKQGGSFRGDFAFEELWRNVDCAISQVCDTTTFAELVDYELAKKSAFMPDYAI